jgi:hypothetical protein
MPRRGASNVDDLEIVSGCCSRTMARCSFSTQTAPALILVFQSRRGKSSKRWLSTVLKTPFEIVNNVSNKPLFSRNAFVRLIAGLVVLVTLVVLANNRLSRKENSAHAADKLPVRPFTQAETPRDPLDYMHEVLPARTLQNSEKNLLREPPPSAKTNSVR